MMNSPSLTVRTVRSPTLRSSFTAASRRLGAGLPTAVGVSPSARSAAIPGTISRRRRSRPRHARRWYDGGMACRGRWCSSGSSDGAPRARPVVPCGRDVYPDMRCDPTPKFRCRLPTCSKSTVSGSGNTPASRPADPRNTTTGSRATCRPPMTTSRTGVRRTLTIDSQRMSSSTARGITLGSAVRGSRNSGWCIGDDVPDGAGRGVEPCAVSSIEIRSISFISSRRHSTSTVTR